MRPRSAEILCPGIRDFRAVERESVDGVLQEPRLLAGRFHEGRREFGLRDLYGDAWKPPAAAHIDESSGTEERSMQKATQRIENVLQYDPALVPGADDVRTLVGGE